MLSGIGKIRVCTGYRANDKDNTILHGFPSDYSVLEQCKPIYEELDGWDEDISNVKNYKDLPANAKKYIGRIEEIIGVKIKFVSVGSSRTQTIIL